MRRIERTGQFKRDYKREAKGQYRATLHLELAPVITALARDRKIIAEKGPLARARIATAFSEAHYRKTVNEIYQAVTAGKIRA